MKCDGSFESCSCDDRDEIRDIKIAFMSPKDIVAKLNRCDDCDENDNYNKSVDNWNEINTKLGGGLWWEMKSVASYKNVTNVTKSDTSEENKRVWQKENAVTNHEKFDLEWRLWRKSLLQ